MKLLLGMVLLASACVVAGCHLYLWAGSRELTIPPVASGTPEPTPAP